MRDLSHIGGFSRQEPITAPVTYKEIPVGMLMALRFSGRSIGKFSGISGIVKGSPVFRLECINHKETLVPGYSRRVCATILNFGEQEHKSISEWNLYRMEQILHSMDLSMEVPAIFW